MGLGAPHLHQEETMGEATKPIGATDGVENIAQEPPHPLDAPTRVSRTWLKRGDCIDMVEEEDVDP